MPTILSVQSRVAYGYVGNSAAVPALQREGCEAWALDTMQLSNHPGHGRSEGRLVPAAELALLFECLAALGVAARCDGVLSGYLGAAATGDALLAILARIREARPGALYACDPVLGDDESGIYVRPGLAEFFRDRAIPAADIATPNRFELELLTGLEVATVADAVAAAEMLRRRGPRTVLVTSLAPDPGRIAMAAVGDAGAWAIATPRLPGSFKGSGDVTAALFLASVLQGRALPEALARTAETIHAVVAATHEAGRDELDLLAGLAAPPAAFLPERL